MAKKGSGIGRNEIFKYSEPEPEFRLIPGKNSKNNFSTEIQNVALFRTHDDNILHFNQKFRNYLHKTMSIVLIFSGIISAIQVPIIFSILFFKSGYSYARYVQVSE